MKVTVIFDVDCDMVKDVSGQESIRDAIESELGWLADSGFSAEEIHYEEEE